MSSDLEEWKPVPDFPDYEVSSKGRVVSLKFGKRRVLKPQINTHGYLQVFLRQQGLTVSKRVHTLVLLAFVGPCPDGMQILHSEAGPQSNDLAHLRYGTPHENMLEVVEHGHHFWALKTHCPQGHEYTEENTYRNQNRRTCRQCRRARSQAGRARVRQYQ